METKTRSYDETNEATPETPEPTREYYESGQLKLEQVITPYTGPFKLVGPYQHKRYDEYPHLEYNQNAEPATRTGKRYDENGQLKREWIDNPDGSGIYKTYHENGQLKRERVRNSYCQGPGMHGSNLPRIRYDENGEPEKAGGPTWTEKRYDENGQLVYQHPPADPQN